MPFAPSSILFLLAMPGAPFLAPDRSVRSDALRRFGSEAPHSDAQLTAAIHLKRPIADVVSNASGSMSAAAV